MGLLNALKPQRLVGMVAVRHQRTTSALITSSSVRNEIEYRFVSGQPLPPPILRSTMRGERFESCWCSQRTSRRRSSKRKGVCFPMIEQGARQLPCTAGAQICWFLTAVQLEMVSRRTFYLASCARYPAMHRSCNMNNTLKTNMLP